MFQPVRLSVSPQSSLRIGTGEFGYLKQVSLAHEQVKQVPKQAILDISPFWLFKSWLYMGVSGFCGKIDHQNNGQNPRNFAI